MPGPLLLLEEHVYDEACVLETAVMLSEISRAYYSTSRFQRNFKCSPFYSLSYFAHAICSCIFQF